MCSKIVIVILILMSSLLIGCVEKGDVNVETESEFNFIKWDGELKKVNGSIENFNVTDYLYIFFNGSEPSEPYFVDEDSPEFLERVDD